MFSARIPTRFGAEIVVYKSAKFKCLLGNSYQSFSQKPFEFQIIESLILEMLIGSAEREILKSGLKKEAA